MKAKLPTLCPSCENLLSVSQLSCEHCQTVVQGNYPLPIFLELSPKEQEFILRFFLASGSLKEMASQLGVSYPTVRNQLDDMIQHIKDLDI
ncbi:MAG TPA: DUF2089 family protein [Flavobacterium sp.]|nr:DUF2089 family protein [Flavobacterium sp.]